jgi:hypothetical protein
MCTPLLFCLVLDCHYYMNYIAVLEVREKINVVPVPAKHHAMKTYGEWRYSFPYF